MTYIIILMDKSEVEITEKEYHNLAGKSGLVHIPSQDRIINTNSIVEVVRTENYRRENEGRSNEGVLHDGIPVIRHFGIWYMKGEYMEEGGKIVPTRMIDPKYYPEVARDCVPSPKEFKEKYEMLPKEERLKLMIGGYRESSGKLEMAGEIIKERLENPGEIKLTTKEEER